MSSIPLMRTALQPLYRDARDAHPGLLLQRGYPEHIDENSKKDNENTKENPKTKHIKDICAIPPSNLYRHAYQRWIKATTDAQRFRHTILKLEGRLFIGLSGGGMLETGCAIHHSYGLPYLPGSSIKGAVNAFVRHRTRMKPEICDQLFGASAESGPDYPYPDGLSGLIHFHDGWWVPDSAPKPLVEEIVTSHHLKYYGEEGAVPASDCDSPVPNAQIAVSGSFLFSLEGPAEWLPIATAMLSESMTKQGMGAKTRSGYGHFRLDEKQNAKLHTAQEQARKEKMAAEEARRKKLDALQAAEVLINMTEQQRLIAATSAQYNAYQQQHEMAQKSQRSDLIGKLNALLKSAKDWPEMSDRTQARELLITIYDQIGWGDPGQKAPKRAKQEEKRRSEINALSG